MRLPSSHQSRGISRSEFTCISVARLSASEPLWNLNLAIVVVFEVFRKDLAGLMNQSATAISYVLDLPGLHEFRHPRHTLSYMTAVLHRGKPVLYLNPHSFYLLKSPNTVPQINQILKLALGLQCIPNRDDEAKRVEKIKNAPKLTKEEKEAKLRRLATRNNIHAIQCLLEREGNSDELTLRAAMLMPNKYGEGRQWEGKYWNLPQLEPYHHFNTIRTRNMEWIGGSKVIPAKTIVRKISFNVNPHSEEWLNSKLAKRKLSLSPYSDARNKCDQTSKKCVIENPSPHDFDEIMKIGKIIGNIELVFTSGLKLDCYNEINTTIHLSERQYAIHALYDLIDKLKDGDREALPPVIREKLNSLLTEAEQNVKSLSDEEYRKSL